MPAGAVFHFDLARKTVHVGQVHAASDYNARTGADAHRSGHVSGGVVGWSGEREALWTASELAEMPKRQRVADIDRRAPERAVARSVVVALPDALPPQERQKLVRGMALWLRDKHGIAVQWDIHAPDPDGDQRNHHAHLLLTTRTVDEAGKFGKKTRELNDKRTASQHVGEWRSEWAKRVNRALEKGSVETRVDNRSKRAVALANGTLMSDGRMKDPPRTRTPTPTYVAQRAGRAIQTTRQEKQKTEEAAALAVAALEAQESRLAALRQRAAEWVQAIKDRARDLARGSQRPLKRRPPTERDI